MSVASCPHRDRIKRVALPACISALPRDHRGYPVLGVSVVPPIEPTPRVGKMWPRQVLLRADPPVRYLRRRSGSPRIVCHGQHPAWHSVSSQSPTRPLVRHGGKPLHQSADA